MFWNNLKLNGPSPHRWGLLRTLVRGTWSASIESDVARRNNNATFVFAVLSKIWNVKCRLFGANVVFVLPLREQFGCEWKPCIYSTHQETLTFYIKVTRSYLEYVGYTSKSCNFPFRRGPDWTRSMQYICHLKENAGGRMGKLPFFLNARIGFENLGHLDSALSCPCHSSNGFTSLWHQNDSLDRPFIPILRGIIKRLQKELSKLQKSK